LDPFGVLDVLRYYIERSREAKDGEVERRKVMVQEQLPLHQKEWQIV
jgi:hypothetical protein